MGYIVVPTLPVPSEMKRKIPRGKWFATKQETVDYLFRRGFRIHNTEDPITMSYCNNPPNVNDIGFLLYGELPDFIVAIVEQS